MKMFIAEIILTWHVYATEFYRIGITLRYHTYGHRVICVNNKDVSFHTQFQFHKFVCINEVNRFYF